MKIQKHQIILHIFVVSYHYVLAQLDQSQVLNQCYTSYFMDQTSFQCQTCPNQCLKCIEGSCLVCINGQKQDQTCMQELETCSKGQYLNSNSHICQNCNLPFCQICESSTTCSKCIEGYEINNKQLCQLINDEQTNNDTKICPPSQQVYQSQCIQNKFCSSETFKPTNTFDSNVLMVIENVENEIIVGLSLDLVILYKRSNLSYLSTLLKIENTKSDIIITGLVFKDTVIVLTNKYIYCYRIENQQLLTKLVLDSIARESNVRFLFADIQNSILTYLALTQDTLNIMLKQFQIIETASSYSIIELPDKKKNLLQSNNYQISKFAFFSDTQFVGIITSKYTYIVNLSKNRTTLINFSLENSLNDKDQIYIQISEEDNTLVNFFVFKQSKLNIKFINVQLSISSDQDKFTLINQSREFQTLKNIEDQKIDYCDGGVQQLNQKLFLQRVCQIFISESSKQVELFLGVAELDYFFSSSQQQFIFEIKGEQPWQKDAKLLLTSIQNKQDQLLVIVPYYNYISFFSIENQKQNIIKNYEPIILHQYDEIINLNIPLEDQSTITFIQGKFIGKITVPNDQSKIEYFINTHLQVTQKNQLFFTEYDRDVSQVIIPRDYKETDQEMRYSFIILNRIESRRFDVIQMETSLNKQQVVVAHKFYYFQQLNSNNLSSLEISADSFLDEIQETLYIITNNCVYSVKYHTLELINFTYIGIYFARNMNTIVYGNVQEQIEFNSLNELESPSAIYDIILATFNNGIIDHHTIQIIGQSNSVSSSNKITFNINKEDSEFFFIHVENDSNSIFNIFYKKQLIPHELDASQVKQTQFLSQTELQIITQYLDDNQILQQNFIKLTLQKDANLEYTFTNIKVNFSNEFDCYLRSYQGYTLCGFRYFNEDLYQYQYVIKQFDWYQAAFKIDQVTSNEYQFVLEVYVEDLELVKIDQLFEKTISNKVYFVLRHSYEENGLMIEQGYISLYEASIDQSTGDLILINRSKKDIIAYQFDQKEFIQNSSIIKYSKQSSHKFRLFSPEKFIYYGGYIENGNTPQKESFSLWKETNSLLFTKDGAVQISKEYNNFQHQKDFKIKATYSCTLIDLGYYVFTQSGTLQIVTQDQLQIIYSLASIKQTETFCANNFQSLVVLQLTNIVVFYQEKQFNIPTYTQSYPFTRNILTNKCGILTYQPYIACSGMGMFNYATRTWINYTQLVIHQMSTVYLKDNQYYAILGVPNKIFIYSFEQNQFLPQKSIEYSNLSNVVFHLHNSIKDQVYVVEKQQQCSIFTLPNFVKIFTSLNLSNKEIKDEECVFEKETPKLIIRTSINVSIYKLPYSASQSPTILQPYRYESTRQMLVTKQSIFNLYYQKDIDQTKTLILDQYDLTTGITTTFDHVLTEKIQINLAFWEEKDIIFMSNSFVSISGSKFGWSTRYTFNEFNQRYNYILAYTSTYGGLTTVLFDVSEILPFNNKSSQLTQILRSSNKQLYINTLPHISSDDIFNPLLNQNDEYIIYFDYQTKIIKKVSLVTNSIEDYLSLKLINSLLANYQSAYSIFKLNQLKNSQDSDIFGFLWNCNLIVFEKNNIIEQFNINQISGSCNNPFYQSDKDLLFVTYHKEISSLMYFDNKIQMKSLGVNLNKKIRYFTRDSQGKWLLIIYENDSANDNNIVIFTNQNLVNSSTLIHTELPIQSSLISKVKFFSFQEIDFLLIGLSDSSNHLIQLSSETEQINFSIVFALKTECGMIKNYEFLIIQQIEDINKFNFLIYSSGNTRVSLIQGVFNLQFRQFENPFSVKVQSLTHTRGDQSLKILRNTFISILSDQQITIYSTSLQYLYRIEEKDISTFLNIILAPDNMTLIITDVDSIYIYLVKQINSRQRLIRQKIYSYIMPEVFSVKYLNQNKDQFYIQGVDANGVFNIKYTQFESMNEESSSNQTNCLYQINSFDSISYQIQQYSQILKKFKNTKSQSTHLFLQIDVNQKSLLLPTKFDSLIENESTKFLNQSINLDVDLQKIQVKLIQQTKQQPNVNLLQSLRIQDGILVVQSPIYLDNMDSLLLKSVKIIFKNNSYINLINIKQIKFENCEIENIKTNSEQISLFQFTKALVISLDIFKIYNQQLTFTNLFTFQECVDTTISSLTVQSSSFKSSTHLIQFIKQTNKISLQNIKIIKSSLQGLLYFQNCLDVQIQMLFLDTIQYNIQNERRLEDQESGLSSTHLPLLQANYIKGTFMIDTLDIDNQSLLYQLLYYRNWILERDVQNNQNLEIQRFSINSRLSLSKFNIKSAQFIQSLMLIEENDISIKELRISDSKDSCLFFENVSKSLKINDLYLIGNRISRSQPLVKIINSIMQIKTLHIKQTNYLSSDSIQNSSYDSFQITESDFEINDLQADQNYVQSSFLSISGIYQYKYDDQYFGQNTNPPYSALLNSTIKSTRGGSAIIAFNLTKFNIIDSNISLNKGATKGAALSSIQTILNYLQNVKIIENEAKVYGGAIYLEESDLLLDSCIITMNKALIGGGVKYNNTAFLPQFLLSNTQCLMVNNNKAIIYAKNYGSYPNSLKTLNFQGNSQNELIAVSSSQISMEFNFQLFDEEGELVNLPRKEEITDTDLLNDLSGLYDFQLSYDKVDGKVEILQQNVYSSYNGTNNSVFTLNKFILNSGWNNIQDNTFLLDEMHPLIIKSVSAFHLKSKQSTSIIEKQQIQLEFPIKFRKCIKGEVIRKVSNNYYECWKCIENTYSIVDPYFNNLQNQCKNCIKGAAFCEGDSIIPMEGFWKDQDSDAIYQCVNSPEVCTSHEGSRLGCEQGYFGPLCESCDYENMVWGTSVDGGKQIYAKSGKYKCNLCSDKISNQNQILLSVFLGLIFICYLGYQIKSNYSNKIIKMQASYLKRCGVIIVSNSLNINELPSFSLKIMISYIQLISLVFAYQINIPSGVKFILVFGNNLETTLYSLDCLFVNEKLYQYIKLVYLRLIWTLLQPFFYIILLSLIFFLVQLKIKIKNKNRINNIFVSGFLKIYYMIYPGFIQQIIGSISCKKLNNKSYVLNDLQFECYDQEYYQFNYGIGIPFLILTIITPLLIMLKLKKNKDHLTKNPNIFISYGFYFSEYKTAYCYWEIIKIYKKIFIYIIIGVFNQNSLISSIFITLIILFYLKQQQKVQPFAFEKFNQLDHISQMTSILTVLFLSINRITDSNIIMALSLIIVFGSNCYFFYKFFTSFSQLLIKKPAFRVVIQTYNSVQKFFPKFLPLIHEKIINICRITRNWKIIQQHVMRKSLQQINIYNLVSRKTLIIKSKQELQTLRSSRETNRFQSTTRLKQRSIGHKAAKKHSTEILQQDHLFSPSISVQGGSLLFSPGRGAQLTSEVCLNTEKIDLKQSPDKLTSFKFSEISETSQNLN